MRRLLPLFVVCASAAVLACAGLSRLTGAGASAEERAAYAQAIAAVEESPPAGVKKLELFVRRFPSSPLADDARLRLGDEALSRGDDAAALGYYERVANEAWSRQKADPARLRAAEIHLRTGDPEAAERLLSRVRISRLARDDQRNAYRALVESSADDVTRLRRLARLRAFEAEADSADFVDVEIDRVIPRLSPRDLERAADQLGSEPPAARVWLRRAELALAAGDRDEARSAVERAGRLPLPPAYAERLASLREQVGVVDTEAFETQALPTFDALEDAALPDTRAARGTLGVVLPLSGPFASFGEETLRGVLLAARVFDARTPGRVRVLVRDSAGRPEQAAAAVRELDAEGVSAVVGPLAAAECEAAAAEAERARLPLLALTAREEIAAARSQVLRLRTRPREEVEALVEHVMHENAAETFAILYPNDAYGRGLRDLFWDTVEARGGQVVAVARYEPDATDFADPIRRLLGYELLTPAEERALARREKELDRARRLPPEEAAEVRRKVRRALGPEGRPLPPIVDFDALFIPESHEKVVLIAPQLAFHEAVGTRLLGPSGWHHTDLVPIARHHVNGAIFTSMYFDQSELPAVRDFSQRYRDTFGAPPEAFAAQGYDAATLVLMQLSDGRRSRDDLRKGLLAVREFPGVTGVLSMRADGNARKRPFLLAVERGEIVQLH